MRTLKKTFVIAMCAVSLVGMTGCSNKPDNFTGVAVVVDKRYTPEYIQMMNTGNNVTIPIVYPAEHYVTVCIDPSDDKSCWTENVTRSFYNDVSMEVMLNYVDGKFSFKK